MPRLRQARIICKFIMIQSVMKQPFLQRTAIPSGGSHSFSGQSFLQGAAIPFTRHGGVGRVIESADCALQHDLGGGGGSVVRAAPAAVVARLAMGPVAQVAHSRWLVLPRRCCPSAPKQRPEQPDHKNHNQKFYKFAQDISSDIFKLRLHSTNNW